MRNLTTDRAYQRALEQYLASPRGSSTPSTIAQRLKKLDPASVGIGRYPNLAQLHNTRVALEELADDAVFDLRSCKPVDVVARRLKSSESSPR